MSLLFNCLESVRLRSRERLHASPHSLKFYSEILKELNSRKIEYSHKRARYYSQHKSDEYRAARQAQNNLNKYCATLYSNLQRIIALLVQSEVPGAERIHRDFITKFSRDEYRHLRGTPVTGFTDPRLKFKLFRIEEIIYDMFQNADSALRDSNQLASVVSMQYEGTNLEE